MPGQGRTPMAKPSHVQNDKFLYCLSFEDVALNNCVL